jgi:hypothetical protein
MKTLLLSTSLALGLGAFALAPASAAPIAAGGVVAAPSATVDVACRTVEKRVRRGNRTVITRVRECGRDRYERRDRYVERRRYWRDGGYRHYDRREPGISVRIR